MPPNILWSIFEIGLPGRRSAISRSCGKFFSSVVVILLQARCELPALQPPVSGNSIFSDRGAS
jgi:hypothetical protein